MRILFVLYFLNFGLLLHAQTPEEITSVRKTLDVIRDRDQKTRTKGDSSEFIRYIDSTNLVVVEEIINKFGWPRKSLFGADANQTCFLVIQHSDSATQEKYLPVLQKSVDDGESNTTDLAMLKDRVLMRRGEKQIYGSQVVFDKQGNPVYYPIADEKNVNERRKKMGLVPIEEYATYFGIEYKFPKE